MKRYLNRDMDMKNSHPLVREMMALQRHEQLAWGDVASRAGICPSAIRHWRTANGPRLTNFEAVLNVLGYELVIQPKAEAVE